MPSKAIKTPPKTSNAKRTKTIARRNNRKLPGSNGIPLVVPRPYTLPPLMRSWVRYVDRVTINTAGVTNTGVYTYCANGLFDPDLIAGGHQPYLYDQMTAIYTQYHVVKSNITWKVMSNAASAATITAFIDDDATPPTTVGVYPAAERPGSRTWIVNAGAVEPLVVKQYFNSDSTHGKGSENQQSLIATSGANPADITCFFLQVCSVAATQSFIVTAEIDFFVEWSELASQTAS